jgi:hypothetical protein
MGLEHGCGNPLADCPGNPSNSGDSDKRLAETWLAENHSRKYLSVSIFLPERLCSVVLPLPDAGIK